MLVFGAIGFIDDYRKVMKKKRNLGLTSKRKFSLQVLASLGVALTLLWLTADGSYSTQLSVPFFKNFHPELVSHSLPSDAFFWWLAYMPFVVFVVCTLRWVPPMPVNLTADGLDGLAIGCVVVAASALTVLSPTSLASRLSRTIWTFSILPQVGELTVFCGSLVGSSLGFLWYNAHPAEVFMGDVGSLALGGAIGTIAVAIKQGNSAVFCRWDFRDRGAFGDSAGRVFSPYRETYFSDVAAAPHHFELAGWSESKNHCAVLDRGFGVFALFSLTTLKLR